MHQSFSKRVFHICMVVSLLVVMLFIFGMVALRYEVEGETNLPFNISKIIVISNISTIEKENPSYYWDFEVVQNNDIYMCIEKNSGYNDTEVIEKIALSNFNYPIEPKKGETKIIRPSYQKGSLFDSAEENIVEEITYTGGLNTNVQKLEIGNQGGIMLFRYANTNLGEYTSNDGDEIKYDISLLPKVGVIKEELYTTLSFDVNIFLKSEKQYQTTITLDMPIEDIQDNKAGGLEITDLTDVVFKRIK